MKDIAKVVVNADNIFEVFGTKFKISSQVKEYRVYNSYKNSKDFTNTSEMSWVNVKMELETNALHFYDEKGKEITKVTIVGEVDE